MHLMLMPCVPQMDVEYARQAFAKLRKEWKEPYFDTPFTRERDGVVLPEFTEGAISRLCPGQKWAAWDGARLTKDRTKFVLPDSTVLLFSTVGRVLGDWMTPIRLLSTYLQIPNGQVKNFLNACRATHMMTGHCRIAVVGSKAQEGGGLWHRYFALWLASRLDSVVIDFFDPAEVSSEWQVEIDGVQVSCQWTPEEVSAVMIQAEGYDAVVDDVWSYEAGPSLPGLDLSQFGHYSIKGSTDVKDGFEPFLHRTETRKFSHPPLQVVLSGCQCLLCLACKACSHSYESYLSLRHLCSRLGHRASCLGVSWSDEMEMVNKTLRHLQTQTVLRVKDTFVFRALMAVSEEFPLKVVGDHAMRGTDIKFIPLHRKERRIGVLDLDVYPWLASKRVVFCGVLPMILGKTKIEHMLYDASYEREADVVFVNTTTLWEQRMNASIVYCPVDPVKASLLFPDWRHTGRCVKTFLEFERFQKLEKVPPVLTRPHTLVSGDIEVMSSLFPYSHTLLLTEYDKELSSGDVYSVRQDGVYLRTIAFDPGLWRTSIVCDRGKWSLLRNNLHLLRGKIFPGFYDSSVPMPWDISEDEFNILDQKFGGEAQRDLRRHYYLDKPLTYVHLKQKYKIQGREILLGDYVKSQSEFSVISDPMVKHVKLIRSPHFLPHTTFAFINDWQCDLSLWRQEGWSSFTKLDKALGLLVSRELG